MKTFVSVVIVLFWFFVGSIHAQQSQDGPFGLSMGMPRAEVEKLMGKFTETQPGVLTSVHVPKPHPDFESYAVVVSPTHGVCKIMAIGKDLQMNSFGDRVKSSFSTMVEILQEKYGQPKMLDYLKAGSIWRDADDWAMALAKEERTLAAMWESHGVLLKAVALNVSKGYLRLTYEAPTLDACLKEATKAQRSVF